MLLALYTAVVVVYDIVRCYIPILRVYTTNPPWNIRQRAFIAKGRKGEKINGKKKTSRVCFFSSCSPRLAFHHPFLLVFRLQ